MKEVIYVPNRNDKRIAERLKKNWTHYDGLSKRQQEVVQNIARDNRLSKCFEYYYSKRWVDSFSADGNFVHRVNPNCKIEVIKSKL